MKNIFSTDKFKNESELDWMAKHAVNSKKVKLANVDEITTFYNSDLKMCVLRLSDKAKNRFHVFDYANRKRYKLIEEVIHTNLDDFMIVVDGHLTIIFRIEIAIFDKIKEEINRTTQK